MLDRRTILAGLSAASVYSLMPGSSVPALAANSPKFELATFKADITPPLGHPLLGGLKGVAKSIREKLEVRGVILLGGEKPLVIAALDWCELRNDAYDSFRDGLANAVGTTRERVLLSCIHQHDAPYFDLTAQKLLDEGGLEKVSLDPEFFAEAVKRTAATAKSSLGKKIVITHFGAGAAKVERVACNRRVELTPGKPTFARYSFTADPATRDADDGPIDPLLQTLAFYDGEKMLATVSVYAVHPMSYYGRGEVSYDFPGMARAMRDQDSPDVFHMYVSGCSGDVVAAKYNTGDDPGRAALAERLATAMKSSVDAIRREPLTKLGFHSVPLEIPPPTTGELAPERLKAVVADKSLGQRQRVTAALGLSYWQRCQTHPKIDLPVIDFGSTRYGILPAEMFVEYQLAAQKMQPEKRILIAGFGECAPGYIPTEKARAEGFVGEHGYCWVKPGCEEVIMAAIKKALE